MKTLQTLIILLVALSAGTLTASTVQAQAITAAQAGAKIDPALVVFAHGRAAQKTAGILIVLQNLSEGLAAPHRYNYGEVVNYLKNVSLQTKAKFDKYLSTVPHATEHFRPHRFFYNTVTYTAVVTPLGLKMAAMAPGVVKIYANHNIMRDPSSRPQEMLIAREAAYPYDLVDVSLDKVRSEFADVTGAGVVIGSVDTGVDGSHPALKGKIKLFYDGHKHAVGTPVDYDTHGTHTVGTMIGDGQGGAPMGTAPRAQMISAAALAGYDVMLESMEFMLDPDKNPNTHDAPRAVNNSWHAGGAPDMELFYRAVNAWEAAGILPVFSAGNAGPGDGTITHPKEHPATFAVGATGENGKVTDFSSRGPAIFNGKQIQKPDVAAPGNNILSSLPGGKYGIMSGTSMAAPHVTGASALLFQIDPRLTPVQIRAIFTKTTNAVDENGNAIAARTWNKAYGLGKINVYQAVKLAKGVSERHEGFIESFFEEFVSSPEVMSIREVLGLENNDTIDPLDFPAGEEGTTWASVSDLN